MNKKNTRNYNNSLSLDDLIANVNFNSFDCDDEDDEEYGKIKKTNSLKSLAPLYIWFILKENSNEENQFSQNQIIKMLAQDPYDIDIKRGALSRIIHTLADSGMGIVIPESGKGVYYDEDACWTAFRSMKSGNYKAFWNEDKRCA